MDSTDTTMFSRRRFEATCRPFFLVEVTLEREESESEQEQRTQNE